MDNHRGEGGLSPPSDNPSLPHHLTAEKSSFSTLPHILLSSLGPNPAHQWRRFTALIAASFAGFILFFTIDAPRVFHAPPSATSLSLSNATTKAIPPNPNNPAPARNTWLSAEFEPNFTAALLARSTAYGGPPCQDSPTVEISIPAIDGSDSLRLSTGEIHHFLFHTLDQSSNPKCSGGDYFETSISGHRWRSRPLVTDHHNGSYGLSLQIHPDFAGDYNLTVLLLFRRFQGLRLSPARFAVDRRLRRIPILFHSSGHHPLPELKACRKSDFRKELWTGRWTKLAGPAGCPVDSDGRFRCVSEEQACRSPWCSGELGRLESNGWVYSAHCSFEIFNRGGAWRCLKNRWIFFWGDSNHVDTVRNLIRFVLRLENGPVVGRRFDRNFTNPEDPGQTVRITSVFNGHWNESGNYLGLHSLQNKYYREMLTSYFSGGRRPDVVVANSGLHDGVYWRSVRQFAGAADRAARFWAGVVAGARGTEFVYRTTVAAGGYARVLGFNPSKMEAFNGAMVEGLRRSGVAAWVIDGFDLTYAWHFDNRCNDGVHYGRPPARVRWRDGEMGHQYFVDLMMCHVILSTICAHD